MQRGQSNISSQFIANYSDNGKLLQFKCNLSVSFPKAVLNQFLILWFLKLSTFRVHAEGDFCGCLAAQANRSFFANYLALFPGNCTFRSMFHRWPCNPPRYYIWKVVASNLAF